MTGQNNVWFSSNGQDCNTILFSLDNLEECKKNDKYSNYTTAKTLVILSLKLNIMTYGININFKAISLFFYIEMF